MKLHQLEQTHRQQITPVVNSALTLFAPYKGQTISTGLWLSLLTLLFSVVQPASAAVASISRTFYDEERSRIFPELPRHEFYLAIPEFEHFVSDMEEVRPALQRAGTTDADITKAAMRAARHVENSGRLTTIRAVESDPLNNDELIVEEISNFERRAQYQRKRGQAVAWARIATGAETCGWCLMLTSRGAVYHSEESAGGDGGWHNGCDCKVVPVFVEDDWEGRDRYKAAEEMWKNETKGYSGRDAINAMRRAAYAGKYQEYLRNN